MANDGEFGRLLEALDEADAALVQALEARTRAVKRFLELREEAPEAYRALPTSAEVLTRARERARHFPDRALEQVFREVLGAADAMLRPVRVAIVGPEGSLAQAAARRHFGVEAELTALEGIAAVVDEVERKRTAYGVVPFETSSEGAIAETIDALTRAEARVCAELTLRGAHHLASQSGDASRVQAIYGTGAAIVACEQTLRREFPDATLLDVRTAAVAMNLAREEANAAAVVVDLPPDAGLRLVRERVEDRADASTRFFVVGHERPPRTGQDRTLLALAVHEEPGALYRALQPFADRGVNLTRIESRASKEASWRYLFILEFDGHMTDRSVLTTIEEARSGARHLKVLGSYPRPR